MIPYVFILILFLIGFKTKEKKLYFFLCALCMFLLVALRGYSVGTDTQNYLRFFGDEIITHMTEPLWEVYMLFVRSLTDNGQIFLAVTAALTLVPFFFLMKKQSSYALLSLFVFFILPTDQGFIFTMSGMRQALAATIVMFEFYACEKRRWIMMALLAVAAFCVHNSSLIALVGLLIMSFVKIKRKTIIVLFVVSVLLMLVSISVADVFSLFQHTWLFQLAFMEDYYIYTTYMVLEYKMTFVRTIFLIVPIFVMFFLLFHNPQVLETIYARLYILGGVFLCAMSQAPMVGRYFMYFIMTEVFLIPQIYTSNSYKYNKPVTLVLLIIQAVILFWYLYVNYANGLDWSIRRVTPYYFFFNAPYAPF